MCLALTILVATVLKNQVLTKNQMILVKTFLQINQEKEKKRKEKKAELVVVRVYIASEVVFKQGSVINQKMSAQQIQNQHQ